MSKVYKKSGEKIKLGNRNACIYTKEKGKTKYIKSNKEMVLLSKELRRLKINTKTQIGGNEPTIIYDYEPPEYIEDEKSIKYTNNIKIVENPEDNPLDYYTKERSYRKPFYYCSNEATKNFIRNHLWELKNIKFQDSEVEVIKWTIPYVENITVLVVGDIHGDIIALENVFEKWIAKGYLIDKYADEDEEPIYTLKENTYVLSTGDLIDYGSKSINVLCAMLRLRKDNPGKVMLLCGNHENTYNISGRTDLDDEINKKQVYTSDEVTIIQTAIKNIGLIGPSMVALHFGDEKEGTYFMHGMYPVKFDKKKLLIWPADFSKSSDISPLEDLKALNLLTDFSKSSDISPLEDLKDLIQWNDLSYTADTVNSKRKSEIWCAIGHDLLIEIMNKYGIKGFIRGHQDRCGAHGHPITEECTGNLSLKTDIDKRSKHYNTQRSCKDSTKEDNGWCTFETSYNWKKLEEKKYDDLLHRVITISMANQKNNIAPVGGYLELTPTLVRPEKNRLFPFFRLQQ